MNTAGLHGLLVIDKPAGMTSRDVVNRVQRLLPRGTRLGHTGTLDPLATGVLVLCVGPATRLAEYVQDMAKTYRAGLLLGARSDTDDADGTITPVAGTVPLELPVIESALRGFLGEIDQVPPAYSAARVEGRRAYDLARRGREVTLEARRVRIDAIDIVSHAWPRLEIEVRCGKGTYIRALARDLGEKLGCGALVQDLRRTRVGVFKVDDALLLDRMTGDVRGLLRPVGDAVAHLQAVHVDRVAAGRLRHGQGIPTTALLPEPRPDRCAAFTENKELVAVLTWKAHPGQWVPEKVFDSAPTDSHQAARPQR
jgi:tRNA pseudouridine55 synthase